MGFFSDLLGTVAGVAGQFLGVAPAPVAPAAAVAPRLLAAPAQLAAISAPPGPTALLAKGTMAPLTDEQRRQLLRDQGILSGRLRKTTTVQTIDPITGTVIRSETFPGGVAVRASDVTAAKRLFRQIRRLDKKLPRKTVKESQLKQLTDRVVKNALERAGDAPDCPK